MLINLFSGLYGPVVIAAFSGAMLFIVVQRTFRGLSRVPVFIVSFLMGITGADTTVSLVQPYLPETLYIDREAGAFICSALIVTVSMVLISRVENYLDAHHESSSRSRKP